MNKNIGDMSESELKDFIIELQEENSRYEKQNKKLKEINAEHKKLNGELREENKKYKEVIDKAIEYIEIHKRKDEFLELNEWGTRELLDILKEVE